MTFEEWLRYGFNQGWCGVPVCDTHDGLPMSDEEYAIMEIDGEPPCMHIIRLYEDAEHKKAIEDSHAASQWRQSGWDLDGDQ